MTKPCMNDVELEHAATRASELGDTATEALCDLALAGGEPFLVHDAIEADRRYEGWMSLGRERGFESRGQEHAWHRRLKIFNLLDAAACVVCDVVLWEKDLPEAPSVLRVWAAATGRKVEQRGSEDEGYIVLSVDLLKTGSVLRRTIDVYLK